MHLDTTHRATYTFEDIYEIRLLCHFFKIEAILSCNKTFCRILLLPIWCNDRQNAGEHPSCSAYGYQMFGQFTSKLM